MKYKIKNLPRFLNHKTLKNYIEKELNLKSTEYNFSYRTKESYGIITPKKEITKFEIQIRSNICKIVPFKSSQKTEVVDATNAKYVDIRDSVTPLWKMRYDEQIESKKNEIEQFYNTKINIHKSEKSHRNNCQFAFGFDTDGNVEIGFRSKNVKDYNIVYNVEDCQNVSKNMKNKLNEIKRLLTNKKEMIYNRNTGNGFLQLLMIKESEDDMMCLVQIQGSEEACKKNEFIDLITVLSEFPFENLYYNITNKVFEGFVQQEINKIRGIDFLIQKVKNKQFKISFFSFFQVNVEISNKICDVIATKVTKNDTLLDLCCGSGFFGIMLSEKFANIIGIENNEESIKNLQENIKMNNITNYTAKKSDVEKEMFYEKSSVILDPPRNGVSKKTIQNIRRNENIQEIFYISCNYRLSYQNIADLCKEETNVYKNSKFTIKSIDAFDMFPFTTGIEVLIHLTREQ